MARYLVVLRNVEYKPPIQGIYRAASLQKAIAKALFEHKIPKRERWKWYLEKSHEVSSKE